MSVVVLSGGVGGAKLVDGLAQVLPPGEVTAIVNTADDFVHLGLRISPDIDSVVYLMAGLADPERGWGTVNETWQFMNALGNLGGADWFNLGDRDLAMHVLRTDALARGTSLADFTAEVCGRLNVSASVLPMSEDRVATVLDTDMGRLDFQDYFVRHQCRPRVQAVDFDGGPDARPCERALAALADPKLAAIMIAPSNPYLSIDPILAVPGLVDAIKAAGKPVVAVSPIVAGTAVKGPTARMMQDFGRGVSHQTIARHYDGLISGMVIDSEETELDEALATICIDTRMDNAGDRRRVARAVLQLAEIY